MSGDKKKTTSHFDPNLPAVFADEGGAIVVDSRDMAAHFDKRHRDVLRKIDGKIVEILTLRTEGGGMRKSAHTPLFREINTIDPSNGVTYRAYEMDEEAFSLIALGFTGAKALKWQLDYVHCFHRMREDRRQAPVAPRMSPADVRAMIKEEMMEAVRLIKGATYGMTNRQSVGLHKRHDGHDIGLAEIGVAVYDTKDAVDKSAGLTVRQIRTHFNIDPKHATKIASSLRIWCATHGWMQWPRTVAEPSYKFPPQAVQEWWEKEGVVVMNARKEEERRQVADAKQAEKAAREGPELPGIPNIVQMKPKAG